VEWGSRGLNRWKWTEVGNAKDWVGDQRGALCTRVHTSKINHKYKHIMGTHWRLQINYIVVDKHSYKTNNTYNFLVFFIKLGNTLFMKIFFEWKKCMNITTTLIFIVICSIIWIDKQLLLMKYIAKFWMKVCFCSWSFTNGWIDTEKSNMMFGLISYIIFDGKDVKQMGLSQCFYFLLTTFE
jgi:hypothetical protein